MKRYAELIGNYKKQRIKSLYGNTMNEETAGVAFGKLGSEFIRTKVVPKQMLA